MSNISIALPPATANWQCPECGGSGTVNDEICPVCLGAKWINSPTVAKWLLDFMESCGSDASELEQLRKEEPDPLTLAVCLGICSAIKRSH